MPPDQESSGEEMLTVRSIEAIDTISAEDWDACNHSGNPFTSHAFLRAAEVSGCAAGAKGWLPAHVVVEDDSGAILGVAPTYLKGHSYGEYVFDWGWAEAYERRGLPYYPKLQTCVPFTPVGGPRLLTRRPDDTAAQEVLVRALLTIADNHNMSSVHITFQPDEEAQKCEDFGLMRRVGIQFHWHNRGYGSYADFLDELVARKRKALKKNADSRETAEQRSKSFRASKYALSIGITSMNSTGRRFEKSGPRPT